jgi:hypothetical protein
LPPGPRLTDEQRACLKEAGIEKPADGQPPTEEQRAAFRAAAQQCGIDLPARPDGPPPAGDGSPGSSGEDQSTSV